MASAWSRPAARGAPGGGDRRDGLTVAWLFVLRRCWSARRVRTHFDPLPIAIALGGLLALARERRVLGFVLLGLGTMTKLFPGLLAVAALVWLRGARGVARRRCAAAPSSRRSSLRSRCRCPARGTSTRFGFTSTGPCRSSRRRRACCSPSAAPRSPGTNLRPDRFKSNGLDGGHAGAVRGAVRRPARVGAGGDRLRSRRGGRTRATWSSAASPRCWPSSRSARSSRRSTSSGWRRSPRWHGCGPHAVALLVAAAIVLTHVEFPSRCSSSSTAGRTSCLIVAARNALLLAALVVLAASLARAPGEGSRAERRAEWE